MLRFRYALPAVGLVLVALGVVALVPPPAPLAAQDREVSAAEVKAAFDRLKGVKDPAVLWERLRALKALGSGAVPHLQAIVAGKQGEAMARVGAIRACYDLGKSRWALEQLFEFVGGREDRRARLLAASLLMQLGSKFILPTLEEKLLAALKATFDPDVQISISRALWFTCKNPVAKDACGKLLDSDADATRLGAALALAEMGDFKRNGTRQTETVADLLRRLEREPTDRGRLAAQLLRQRRLGQALEKRMLGPVTREGTPGANEAFKPDLAAIQELERMIRERYIDREKSTTEHLAKAGAEGMLLALDPYSAYLPDESARATFADPLQLATPSIGVHVGRRSNDFFRVIAPIAGSPADRAGLKPLDLIVEIDGVDVTAKTLADIITALRGAPGTTAKVTVIRAGWFVRRTFTVERQKLQAPPVTHGLLPAKVGYVRLPLLGAGAPGQLRAALAALKEQGATRLLLDLRGCPAGSLEVATEVAGLFVKTDTAVAKIVGRGEPTTLKTTAEPVCDWPLAVLVGPGTAGPAEVLAGALGQAGRGIVVGQPTFGKAVVQELLPLKSRERQAHVLLTVAHAMLPDGTAIHDKGITPKVEVKYRALPGWVLDEYETPAFATAAAEYVKQLAAEPAEALATFDGFAPASWPGLEALRAATKTRATLEQVRAEVRRRARARFPALTADAQEDDTVFAALAALFDAQGMKLAELAEYQKLVKARTAAGR